ncbi:sugar transporter [Lentinula lateritia]|uniref:Sugar transporter n=1 Tax=Lentinula lateritia TaxID=40482 RepID=A0ABQ8VM42_9AGAR|nr:sugar transporter [Lentinula lateritia]
MGVLFNTFIAAFSSIGAFLFGGIIASVLTMSRFETRFGADPSIQGAIVSTFSGGCFFGAAIAGWLNDRYGRKRTIQFGASIILWGCAMQTGGHNTATLILGRIIAGFAIGFVLGTEIAPPKIRGFLVGLTQECIGIGFLVANWVGYGCQFIDSDASWRLPLGLQLLPAALLLIGVQFLPYSPRWLLEVGRDEEARKVVYLLHGAQNSAELEEAAEEEYNEMHDTIKAEILIRSRKISDLWATHAMMKRTLISCAVQIFTQFTGINIISYFGPLMWQSLGMTGGKALLMQGIYGVVGPIATLIFILFIVDRVGRKKPLIFGATTFVATFSIVAAILATNPVSDTSTKPADPGAQIAGIAMIFLTNIVFSASFGPVSWVLASEVFPTSTRSIGTSVATCCNWAFNTMLSQVSPIGISNVGYKFYLVFVCCNFVNLIVMVVFFPETKGKTLEEMAEVFGDSILPDAQGTTNKDEDKILEPESDTKYAH